MQIRDPERWEQFKQHPEYGFLAEGAEIAADDMEASIAQGLSPDAAVDTFWQSASAHLEAEPTQAASLMSLYAAIYLVLRHTWKYGEYLAQGVRRETARLNGPPPGPTLH